MGEQFTIQISSKLMNQLADGGEKLMKKTKKPRQKLPGGHHPGSQGRVSEKPVSSEAELGKGTAAAGWAPQSLLFRPVSTPQSSITEVDATRSVLRDSQRVLDKLKKQEEHMVHEVTERAKHLHEEFKFPYQKPMPCMAEKDACLECYKENVSGAFKCARVVRSYADCARRAGQQAN